MTQQTKLDRWCTSIIEAGWLAALIVAPLFFNVYSSRVFEPDKISLIRSIALVMLLATRMPRRRTPQRMPRRMYRRQQALGGACCGAFRSCCP
jgi:hypothetical protein